MAYTDAETSRWRDWFTLHPDALDVPFADGRMATVRGLVVHIFTAELRYAERVTGLPVTSWDDVHARSIDEIFALGAHARGMLRKYIEAMTEADANTVLVFPTLTAGTLSATKRKITSNVFIHGIRHWAQVATVLRTSGSETQWGHDMLLTEIGM